MVVGATDTDARVGSNQGGARVGAVVEAAQVAPMKGGGVLDARPGVYGET